jgi:hypothetical protein
MPALALLGVSVNKENLPPEIAFQNLTTDDTPKSPAQAPKKTGAELKKSSRKSSKAKAVSASSKAVWTDHDDRVLINTLLDQREKGHQSDSGFKMIAYTACAEALALSESESGGVAKTAKLCQDHWTTVSDERQVPVERLTSSYSS